jgi:hypothetical protein
MRTNGKTPGFQSRLCHADAERISRHGRADILGHFQVVSGCRGHGGPHATTGNLQLEGLRKERSSHTHTHTHTRTPSMPCANTKTSMRERACAGCSQSISTVLICFVAPRSTCMSTLDAGSNPLAQKDCASPSTAFRAACWAFEEVADTSAPKATSLCAAPSPTIETQKFPRRGIFSWPLGAAEKTLLPSLDSAEELQAALSKEPPPDLGPHAPTNDRSKADALATHVSPSESVTQLLAARFTICPS